MLIKLDHCLNLCLEHPKQVRFRIFLEILNLPYQIIDLCAIPILLMLLRLIVRGGRPDLFQRRLDSSFMMFWYFYFLATFPATLNCVHWGDTCIPKLLLRCVIFRCWTRPVLILQSIKVAFSRVFRNKDSLNRRSSWFTRSQKGCLGRLVKFMSWLSGLERC